MADIVLFLTIPGKPVPKERARTILRTDSEGMVARAMGLKGAKARTYTPRKTANWEQHVATMANIAWRSTPLPGPVEVQVTAVAARPKRLGIGPRVWRIVRPDGDNVQKAVLDALKKGGVLVDDCVVARKRVDSVYAASSEHPCVEIVVRLLSEPPPSPPQGPPTPCHVPPAIHPK